MVQVCATDPPRRPFGLWQAPASTYKTKKKGKVRYVLLAQGCTAGGFVCDCAMGARALLYPRPRAPANSRPGFPIWVVWCCSLACACQWHGLLAWREFRFLPPALNQGEGAERFRAAPARAWRGWLLVNTPMPGTPPFTWAAGSICIIFNDGGR